MKCKKCGHEIGPEERICSNCGAENSFATKHRKNMKQFAKAYGAAKKEVISSAQKTRGLAIRAAILIALIIGCLIMAAITSHNYSDPDPGDDVRRDTQSNTAADIEEAKRLLERGEYMEYVSFLRAHGSLDHLSEEAEELRSVTYFAEDYYECIERMEMIVLRSDDPEYFDGSDNDIRIFCIFAESFYTALEKQNYREDEAYLDCIEDMADDLGAALKTYFSMNDEELQEFIAASEAQKAVRMEAAIRHE